MGFRSDRSSTARWLAPLRGRSAWCRYSPGKWLNRASCWVQDSKDRQWIDWRACAAFHRKRRKCNHKLVPSESSRGFDDAFQIQVLNDADAHRLHDDLMDGIADDALVRTPARPRIPVDVEIMSKKRRFSLFDPGKSVGEVSGDLSGPRSFFCATLPASDVKQNDIAWSCLHSSFPFPRFKIRTSNR